jgi:aryl-alcohol dehydrogenase-like predicted oxidoreductase
MGLNFFDTAEVYTGGNSERLIGTVTQKDTRPVIIASKFAPLPNRFSPHALMKALDATLQRLQRETIDLYYVHFPFTFLRIEDMMDEMALAVRAGKVRAVGVSNFNAEQMRRAAVRLARYDIPLAANEVHYSLLHRKPETNGVLDACRELNVALVAYFPLESGKMLSSDTSHTPSAFPKILGTKKAANEAWVKLHATLNSVARDHDKTVTQIIINWLLMRDEHIIPIPGVTSDRHANENGGSIGWQLSSDEFAAIDQASQFWLK